MPEFRPFRRLLGFSATAKLIDGFGVWQESFLGIPMQQPQDESVCTAPNYPIGVDLDIEFCHQLIAFWHLSYSPEFLMRGIPARRKELIPSFHTRSQVAWAINKME